jgi:hypothetical protein
MKRTGRRARLLLPESEDDQIPPHVRVVNIVIKILDPNQYPTLSMYTIRMLNDLNDLNLFSYIGTV